MKRITILAGIGGLVLFGVLVAFSGAGDVMEAVRTAGWATLYVTLIRAAALAVDGIAWRQLFPRDRMLGLGDAVGIRFVREGVNQLLPVAAVGGDFVGARLAAFRGQDGALAGASVIADIAVAAATQLVFAAAGLALLVWLTGDSTVARTIGWGIGLATLGLIGFFLVQRRQGSALLLRLARSLAGGREWSGIAAAERVFERLGEIYASRRNVAASAATHMAVWVGQSIEVWVALHWMGHPVTFAEAFVIESLSQAGRGAAFAVPGGLGVQEGGFIALCAAFGVPPGPAVALSLLKRVGDVALGVPALVAWQVMEGRHALRSDPAPLAGGPP